MPKKYDTESFIEKAKSIHNNIYKYDKTIFSGIKNNITIICQQHGEFIQSADSHINKRVGCQKCGMAVQVAKRTSNALDFVNKATSVHGDYYDYSDVVYKTAHVKVIIKCKVHGEFLQQPSSHLAGSGCPLCGAQNTRLKLSKNKEWFIERSREIHGNKYIYDAVSYKNNSTKIIIICRIHGNFSQTPASHLNGNGCSLCANAQSSENKTLTTEDFIKKAIAVHGDEYDYSNSKYVTSDSKIQILCKVHGIFEQTASSHCSGCKCPKCANRGPSKSEVKISELLTKHEIDFVFQKRFYDCRNPRTNYILPFDFYLPLLNTVIEYDGVQHFVQIDKWEPLEYIQYKDSIKNKFCLDNGIQLIRISYNDSIEEILKCFGILQV